MKMDFMYVFEKMIELFLIVIVGYIACKFKIFDKEARVKVTKLVLNITLPAMILSSVMTQDKLPNTAQIMQLLLVAMASYIILFAAAFLVPKLLRVKKNQEGIYRFMLAFGNVGFIGFPVTQAIFGDSAVFYTSVFNMPFNLFVYSAGLIFIQQCSEEKTETRITYKTFLTPCMVASVIAIIMALCGWKGPALIGETCDIVAAITTPAALMIIGSSLADMPVKEMLSNGRIYLFAVFRLIFLPLITYAVFGLFVKEPLLLGICVIMAAMPVATNGTMLCLQCNGDEKLMAQGTFITTLLSIVTIPLIAMLVTR